MRKILLVEDTEDNMEILKRIFRNGFKVLKAYSGEEAVEMVLKEKPDIILMDIRLPDISGIEATRRIKSNPSTKDIPIVALSATIMPETIENAKKAGCIDFISRPVMPKLLRKRIEEIIEEYCG